MKLFPWKIVRDSHTPSDVLIEKVKNILFPAVDVRRMIDEEGQERIYHIDHSVDMNLESVLADLEEDVNNKTTRESIKGTIQKLEKVRDLLEAHMILDSEASLIVVESDYQESSLPVAADG